MLGMAMPKAVQIRDVPDDTVAVLRARAAAEGMSMSEYLRSELIRLASRPTQEELFARIESRRGELRPGEAARTIRGQRGPLPAED
jgi:plasmid stability protein